MPATFVATAALVAAAAAAVASGTSVCGDAVCGADETCGTCVVDCVADCPTPQPSAFQPTGGYAAYAWDVGFLFRDAGPTCRRAEFVDRAVAPECWSSVWDGPDAVAALVQAATLPGRNITSLFVSSLPVSGDACDPRVAQLVTALHAAGVTAVYRLYAVSTEAVPEADKVRLVGEYNAACATTAADRLDGVAINNEAFAHLTCSASGATDAARLAWIDRLFVARANADEFGVLLHLSLGWHWGWCTRGDASYDAEDPTNTPLWVDRGGVVKPAHFWMLDAMDSVDVQVAWAAPATMADRAQWGGYSYAVATGTTFFVLAYLNDAGNDDCRLTFMPPLEPPAANCAAFDHTEAGLWAALDDLDAHGLPAARGGLHYVGGVFSTGFPGWPVHAPFREAVHVPLPAPLPAVDVPSPGRGMYVHTETHASSWSPLTLPELHAHRAAGYTLMLRLVVLDTLAEALDGTPPSTMVPAAVLTGLADDLSRVAAAGMKCILRFAYTVELRDAPPYGDPTPDVVLAHIAQLVPVAAAGRAGVAFVQAGFVGTWGEWYYTTHFGQPGAPPTDAQWAARGDVVRALLPIGRPVLVRTPMIKASVLAGTSVVPDVADALPDADAHGDTDAATVGHHNDCFLASATDFGTYTDLDREYPYLQADTRFVAMGGETCAANPPRSQCSVATLELRRFHYTFLNSDYHPDVLAGWQDDGCLDDIRALLGYRLAVTATTMATDAASGAPVAAGGQVVALTTAVVNTGFAAPVARRRVHLVLRNVASGDACVGEAPGVDVRRWLPQSEAHPVALPFLLPPDMPAGEYDVLLALSDEDAPASASHRMAFANGGGVHEGWGSGLNRLGHRLQVAPAGGLVPSASQPGAPHPDHPTVVRISCAPVDTDPVLRAEAVVPSLDGACPRGYVPSATNTLQCDWCPAGVSCAADGTVTPCAAGHYSLGGDTECRPRAGPPCANGGQCGAATGSCVCATGWTGAACNVADPTGCAQALPHLLYRDGRVWSRECVAAAGHDCLHPDGMVGGAKAWRLPDTWTEGMLSFDSDAMGVCGRV